MTAIYLKDALLHRSKIYALLRLENRWRRLKRNTEHKRHPARHSAENASMAVSERNHLPALYGKSVVVFRASKGCRLEAVAELNALYAWNSEHRLRDRAIDAVEHGASKTHREIGNCTFYNAAYGIALLLGGKNIAYGNCFRDNLYAIFLQRLKRKRACNAHGSSHAP